MQNGQKNTVYAPELRAVVTGNEQPMGVLNPCLNGLVQELVRAGRKYETHPTIEHSMFVLQEEFEELCSEVYKRPAERDYSNIATEAYQVAAMAIRLVLDMNYNNYMRSTNGTVKN